MSKIVCLCGSTKFKEAFELANKTESLKGNIVLSVGLFGHIEGLDMNGEEKKKLDELHLRKIDLCNEVLVLNVGGYIGESTRNEIKYATSLNKEIRYLESDLTEATPDEWYKIAVYCKTNRISPFKAENYEKALIEIRKQKIEYPLFRRSKNNEMFRFDEEYKWTCVLSDEENRIGDASIVLNIYDMNVVKYDKSKCLYHLQPCWELCYTDKSYRAIAFYRADLYESGRFYVEPINIEQLKAMPFIWDMYKRELQKEEK